MKKKKDIWHYSPDEPNTSDYLMIVFTNYLGYEDVTLGWYSSYTTSMYDNSHYDYYFRLQNHSEMNMSQVVKWCYYHEFKDYMTNKQKDI